MQDSDGTAYGAAASRLASFRPINATHMAGRHSALSPALQLLQAVWLLQQWLLGPVCV